MFAAVALAAVALLRPVPARAAPVARLSELFRAQLGRVPEAVAACQLDFPELAEGESSWQVSAVVLGVSPFVSVGIASVIKLQVTPELDLIWTRD